MLRKRESHRGYEPVSQDVHLIECLDDDRPSDDSTADDRSLTATTSTNSPPRPCVFLDRDGTVTREAGYINHPERLELLPGAAAAIRRLNDADVLTVIVSNQAGLARGYFDEAVLRATMDRLRDLLAARNARLDAIYYAPCHPSAADPRWRDDPDELRKPGVGMIRRAQARLPIDMTRAWVVGDRHTDLVFAHRAGLPGILVKSGYGLGEWTYERERWTEQPEHVADDLREAVAWILRELKKKNRIE